MLARRITLLTAAFAGVIAGLQAQTPVLTTLHQFEGLAPSVNKGSAPRGALTFGADGLLYGVTQTGGASGNPGAGLGSVFKITTGGTFTSLIDFDGTTKGNAPSGTLCLASDGNFYGTTAAGGTLGSDSRGCIFQITPAGVLTTIFTFGDSTKRNTGSVPNDALAEDSNGYLYGTTTLGGLNNVGIAYKIALGTSNTPVKLGDFGGSTLRGSTPTAVIRAKDGNFYGATRTGGIYTFGTIFKITAAGAGSTLSDFGSITGAYTGPSTPTSALVEASSGVFFGTTTAGGTGGFGTVYTVAANGTYKAVINFTGTAGSFPGDAPEAPLMKATDGYLYGTTTKGGASNRGTVFKLLPNGSGYSRVITFTGGLPTYGEEPRAALVQDNDGYLYGTTSKGGSFSLGTVFSIDNALPDKAFIATGALDPGQPNSGTRASPSCVINPQGGPVDTTYWVEYGTTAAYGSRFPLATATQLNAGRGTANLNRTITLPAGSLLPGTQYHYRFVASNGGGVSYGGDQSFTTGPNPEINSQPQDQLVAVGTASQFDVVASGDPLKYAWHKISAPSSVLNSTASYRITSTQLANGDSYAVRVSEGVDVVTSATVRLGVVNTANKPSVTVNEGVTEPTKLTLLTCDAKGPGLTFQWMKNASPVANAVATLSTTAYSGAQTSVLTIKDAKADANGTYTCVVSLGALTLTSGNFPVVVRLKPVINTPMLGPWTTNGIVTDVLTAQNSPTKWTATLLPSGVTINATTGALVGRPTVANTYNPQFTATNLAGSDAENTTVIVLPASFDPTGTYTGIIDRDLTANDNLGGFITITLSTTGTGTGSLLHRGVTSALKVDLTATPGTTRSMLITGTTATPTILATLDQGTATITGTVAGEAFVAKRRTSAPGIRAGITNVALSPTTSGDPALIPQGSGYVSINVASTGIATWLARFGDGIAVTTATSALSSDGEVPIHATLYAGTNALRGSLQGNFLIQTDGSVTSPGIDWFKPLQPTASTTLSYKSGFALHPLTPIGSRYVKPVNANVLGYAGTTNNAQFTFSSGGLTANFSQLLNFPISNAITVPAPVTNTVKVNALNLTTGLFSGSFVLADPTPANVRTVSFFGVLLQRTQEGLGHFNLPQIPNPSTSQQRSGKVALHLPIP